MRYLGLALFAEGLSDHRFLSPLLRRLTEEQCRRHAREVVDVGSVVSLHSPAESTPGTRSERISRAARAAWPQWNVLFVHTDGATDSERARAERVAPAVRALRDFTEEGGFVVGVVPVRETEAWILGDGEALRAALGVTFTDSQLGVPTPPSQVQGIADPKRAFKQACRLGRRSRGPDQSVYLRRLGETISLDRLLTIPAFRELARELRRTLTEIRLLES